MKFLVFTLALLVAVYVNAQTFIRPDPNVRMYSASAKAFSPPSNPTDMCVIKGSATKVVKVVGVEFSTNQNTTGTNEIQLIKRSTADVGGNYFAMSTTAWDSGFPAPTAVASSYIGNPTSLGSNIGVMLIKRVLTPVSSALGNPVYAFLDPQSPIFSPIPLRGTSENLAIGYNGVASSGGFTVNCNFQFIEE